MSGGTAGSNVGHREGLEPSSRQGPISRASPGTASQSGESFCRCRAGVSQIRSEGICERPDEGPDRIRRDSQAVLLRLVRVRGFDIARGVLIPRAYYRPNSTKVPWYFCSRNVEIYPGTCRNSPEQPGTTKNTLHANYFLDSVLTDTERHGSTAEG